jgi:hypothetical protein
MLALSLHASKERAANKKRPQYHSPQTLAYFTFSIKTAFSTLRRIDTRQAKSINR